jgi:hypothetical protein
VEEKFSKKKNNEENNEQYIRQGPGWVAET